MGVQVVQQSALINHNHARNHGRSADCNDHNHTVLTLIIVFAGLLAYRLSLWTRDLVQITYDIVDSIMHYKVFYVTQ